MILRNRSRYDTAEVRALVRFATADIDMRGVCVNVKNTTASYRGMAYQGVPYVSNAPPSAEYLVTIGIGPESKFPKRGVSYGGVEIPGPRGRWPRYNLNDWREGLVMVAAHEACHIEQFKEGLRRSDLACERFAVRMLERYRAR